MIRARGKRAFELATATGWWAERFAREERLSSLGHYLKPSDPADADDGDALIASLASMHGLVVEDLEATDG